MTGTYGASGRQLTAVDLQVLRAVNRFRYLTSAQLNRVLWPDNTRDGNRYAQRRLKRLIADEYVLPLRELPRPAMGSAPTVHAVAWRGRQALMSLGESVPSYYRPGEQAESVRNPAFMPHTLAIIDVLIAAERLSQDTDGVRLTRLMLERDVRRLGLSISLPGITEAAGSRRVGVVPDAVFSLSVGENTQHFLVEVDRGTERPQVWRDKVAGLALWLNTAESRLLLPGFYTTVMVVTPSESRRDALRGLTAAELAARGLYHEFGSLFLLTAVSAVDTQPVMFFADAHWYPVFAGPPDTLINLSAS